MDRHTRPGAVAQLRRGAEVISVGEDDARHSLAGQRAQHTIVHLHRIDRDISRGMTDESTVEIVAVALGEPRPGEDAGDDLAQGHVERVPRRTEEWKMTDDLRVPKRRVQAEVLLPGGGSRQVTFFLSEFAPNHTGPERLSDLLNAQDEFVAAVDTATHAVSFLGERTIVRARLVGQR